MTLLSSKWMIFGEVLFVVLFLLYIFGKKSVHTEISIPAPSGTVWSVLTDIQNTKTWNPVLIPLEGELKEGTQIKYEFRQDENSISTIPATVKQIIDNRLLNQTGGMPGLLTFDHKYKLEPADGGTKVTIHEDYRGIMVPFWNPAPVEEAYKRLASALKDQVALISRQEVK